ncbi:MAG: hypothetical protein GQ534_09415 [Candidatus Delongbacteria bacterium]|nr:hypothetical protein [Candidatus Delongbacteria bacterium]
MKVRWLMVLVLAILLNLTAQEDVRIKLPTSDASSGFSVTNAEATPDTLIRVRADGNVGIGTTAPGYKLDVNGDLNVIGDFYQNGTIFEGGSSLWSETGNDIFRLNGNVGIGTDSPTRKLDVIGDIRGTNIIGNGSGLTFLTKDQVELGNVQDINIENSWSQESGQHILTEEIKGRNGTTGLKLTDFYGNGIIIKNSGNVGIGAESTLYKLYVGGDIKLLNGVSANEISIDGTLSGNSNLVIPTEKAVKTYVDSNSSGSLWTEDGSDIYRVNGNVGIGTNNPTEMLDIGGSVRFAPNFGHDYAMIIDYITSTPTVRPMTDQQGYLGTSGYRWYEVYSVYKKTSTLKGYQVSGEEINTKNVQPISGALSKIRNIDGVVFKSEESSDKDRNKFLDDNEYGIDINGIEKYLPELVSIDKESGEKSVSYMALIPVLTEAIKEQQSIIEKQNDELNELKSRMDKLESLLNK